MLNSETYKTPKTAIDALIPPRDDPAGKLAQFVEDLSFEDIPAAHIEHAKKAILDAMAGILGGSKLPVVQTVVDSMVSWADGGKGRILVFGNNVPLPMAAYANGVIARAADMGDTGVSGGHICEWIVPALLTDISGADRLISGKEFLTAFVAGAEWGTREHTMIHLQQHTKESPGEVAGARYATAALAKLNGFSAEQIWNAIGMSFSAHPQAEEQKYTEGTADISLQHGFVVQNAIQIVDLVKRGMTSIHGVYMGIGGLMKNVKHGDLEPPEFLTEGLGERWYWHQGHTMKYYCGCYYSQTAIYGLLRMMKEHNLERDDIAHVHFITSSGCAVSTVPIEAKRRPQTPSEAMFSNPYSVAYAVFHGDCFLDAYKWETIEEHLRNPEFTDFMEKLTYEVDEMIPTPFGHYRITLTAKDGRTWNHTESALPGGLGHPMTMEQIGEKLIKAVRFSAVDLGMEKYRSIIQICSNLENITDMRVLVKALSP